MGKRGQKTCPECSGTTGPRSHRCPHCHHKFEKRVVQPKRSNHGRGKKTCPGCESILGVRTRECPSCDYKFKIKTHTDRVLPNQITDWESLTKGTRIRVVGGSGPYYRNSDGENQYTTSRGKYIVQEVCEDGLCVVGDLTSKSSDAGFSFLYMGPKVRSPLCSNLWRDACKIVRVK